MAKTTIKRTSSHDNSLHKFSSSTRTHHQNKHHHHHHHHHHQVDHLTTTTTIHFNSSLIKSSSLLFFILFSLAIACLCLYDILRQTVIGSRLNSIQLTITTIASCLLVISLSISISISRYFTVNRSLSSIPRPYIPISHLDLPAQIHQSIIQDYARVAIISHLSTHPLHHKSSSETRIGTEAWPRPGTIHHGNRFADQVLHDFKALDRALDGLLPPQPLIPIPTRQSSLQGPLTRYLEILSPSSHTQPTPILLTSPQKLLLKRYATILQKAVSPSGVVTEEDYEISCKCLVILVDRINLCRSDDWSNPPGYGQKGDPVYQGIRFKDAIIETAIKLEQSISQQFSNLLSQSTRSTKPTAVTSPLLPSPIITAIPTTSSSAAPMPGTEATETLIKKIFPAIYPAYLPSAFGPIISGYESLLTDIIFYHPDQERTQAEYQYALRCIGSLISHLDQHSSSLSASQIAA